MILRLARPEDGLLLEAIERACFQDPNWEAAEFLRYACLVAELDGRPVGFVVTREVFPAVQNQPTEREILNLAVLPEHRRTGIAKSLLQEELRRGGTHFLEVRESNAAARQLYKNLGFIEIGSRKNYYDNPPETAIVMQMK